MTTEEIFKTMQTLIAQQFALDDEEIKLLEMDLKDMAYTSSAGLRVFMAMHQLMDKRGGKMVLKDPTEEVMGTFRITCFDDIFNIE